MAERSKVKRYPFKFEGFAPSRPLDDLLVIPAGTVTVSDECELLAGKIRKLEQDSHVLASIRATLLLNFNGGEKTPRPDIVIPDKMRDSGTTQLLVFVLEKLTEKGNAKDGQ